MKSDENDETVNCLLMRFFLEIGGDGGIIEQAGHK